MSGMQLPFALGFVLRPVAVARFADTSELMHATPIRACISYPVGSNSVSLLLSGYCPKAAPLPPSELEGTHGGCFYQALWILESSAGIISSLLQCKTQRFNYLIVIDISN